MEIILLEKIEKLGNVGDVVNVKNGYARNYLIPSEKALRATNENKAVFEAKKAEIEKEIAEKQKEAEKIAKSIEGKFSVLIRQAGEDGRLYGSVTAKDIADSLANFNNEVNKKHVALNQTIKYLGVYPIAIKLHSEVTVNVNVNVARSNSEAEDAKKDFLNPKPKKEENKEAEVIEPKQEEAASNSEEKGASPAEEDKKE